MGTRLVLNVGENAVNLQHAWYVLCLCILFCLPVFIKTQFHRDHHYLLLKYLHDNQEFIYVLLGTCNQSFSTDVVYSCGEEQSAATRYSSETSNQYCWRGMFFFIILLLPQSSTCDLLRFLLRFSTLGKWERVD